MFIFIYYRFSWSHFHLSDCIKIKNYLTKIFYKYYFLVNKECFKISKKFYLKYFKYTCCYFISLLIIIVIINIFEFGFSKPSLFYFSILWDLSSIPLMMSGLWLSVSVLSFFFPDRYSILNWYKKNSSNKRIYRLLNSSLYRN